MDGLMQTTSFATKTANLGGSGGETEFEQAFSSLAYAYLRDKAPRLLDHMVGFQLVDRNEDNTKAMGIFGFQLDQQWLYAPVFFLNGDLKGHELLYMKGNDSFVPLKENWINYVMSRKPHILGESSSRELSELGGMEPDIRSLSQIPAMGGKRASDDSWLSGALPMIAAFRVKSANSLYRGGPRGVKLNQSEVVKEPFAAALAKEATNLDFNRIMPTSFALLKCARDTAERYPQIKKAMHQFYGTDCFYRWGTQLRQNAQLDQSNLMPKQASAPRPYMPGNLLIPTERSAGPVDHEKTGKIRMYVYEEVIVDKAPELDDADREKLLKDTVLIKDERDGDEVSVAYNTQVEAQLTNPSETALYRVLEKPGKFTKMLIVMNGSRNRGREAMATVVRLDDGKKAWLNTHPTNVFADQISEREEWDEWFEGLGGAESLKEGGEYIAIGSDGSASVPFRVDQKQEDKQYRVDFRTYIDWNETRPVTMPRVDNHYNEYGDGHYNQPSTFDALLTIGKEGAKGTKIRAISGELRVPDDFKFLKLKDPPKPYDGDLMAPCCGEPSGSETKPIQLGKIDDIQLLFHEKTARMKVFNNGTDVYVDSPLGHQRMTKKAALLDLVRTHGFREKVAREILSCSERQGHSIYRVAYAPGYGLEKSANPHYSMLAGGPSAPVQDDYAGYMGQEQYGNRSVPAQYGGESTYTLDHMSANQTDPSVYDPWQNYEMSPDQSMQVAQQAGAEGQKEVFDTSMISGMLKTVRQDSLVERHLGSLVEALDALGRLLMNFYWHGEEFEDRYGKSDLPELEDSLRNAFEGLGDVTLFLKEKTIESPLEAGDVDLDEASRN